MDAPITAGDSQEQNRLFLAPTLLPKPESPPPFPHTPLVLPVPCIPVLTHYPFPGFSELTGVCDYQMDNTIILFCLIGSQKGTALPVKTFAGQELPAW